MKAVVVKVDGICEGGCSLRWMGYVKAVVVKVDGICEGSCGKGGWDM